MMMMRMMIEEITAQEVAVPDVPDQEAAHQEETGGLTVALEVPLIIMREEQKATAGIESEPTGKFTNSFLSFL